ncbi:MAG: hypothetical protein HOH66_10780 [Rhodospirillaceae bacterium]|nr:hypothetical protein [Rhodospirillaceae bacterium]MBT6118337.1 hypothetical protein [Rhodospirillaceae bacterium]
MAGSRNSAPALSAIQQQSQSTAPTIGCPVPYALTAMIVLIYGYVAMLIACANGDHAPQYASQGT